MIRILSSSARRKILLPSLTSNNFLTSSNATKQCAENGSHHRTLTSSSSSSSSWSLTNNKPYHHPFMTSKQKSNLNQTLGFSSTATIEDDDDSKDDGEKFVRPEREEMPFDVLIVGGGPSGLATSIRLKQLCMENDIDLSVCIVEKGSEIGSHILSGNVFDPKAMHELFPDLNSSTSSSPTSPSWTESLLESTSSHATPVTNDEFLFLTQNGNSYKVPHALLPPQLNNEGNYILSLGQLCRWLAEKAEEMGVEIYPGFAADEVLFGEDDEVRGVATKDVGIDKNGKPKSTYERGVALLARQTIFAEGARGSCSESLIQHYNLRSTSSSSSSSPPRHEQTYGLGIKEVWEIPPENHKPGHVQHTLGYPLQSSPLDSIFGGTFLYHQEPNLVLAGLVIGLDYENPYISPYEEFQRWKQHGAIRGHFEGGTCISYGARVLNEGGLHSLPQLTFPGGMLVGCAAGFLNSVKIKGSHTAMKSGMIAAECIFEGLTSEAAAPVLPASPPEQDGDDVHVVEAEPQHVAATGEIHPLEQIQQLKPYETRVNSSWVYDELYQVRNCHEAFSKWGLLPGLIYTGFATFITKGREPWTLHPSNNTSTNGDPKRKENTDSAKTKPKDQFEPIDYPSHDGILTFDLLTNLQRSGTYHEDDQESHLRIKEGMGNVPGSVSLGVYAAPEQRFCPARVYEYVDDDDAAVEGQDGGEKKKLVINAQNCIHCKCCSIKMPHEYIDWTVPEGGGGPQYQVM